MKSLDDIVINGGRVMDQADLSGVLDALHEFHLPILSVQLIRKLFNKGERI